MSFGLWPMYWMFHRVHVGILRKSRRKCFLIWKVGQTAAPFVEVHVNHVRSSHVFNRMCLVDQNNSWQFRFYQNISGSGGE